MSGLGAVLHDLTKASDACFAQANRSRSGFLTPGELLLQLELTSKTAADAAAAFPELFLKMDVDGDNKITKQDVVRVPMPVASPCVCVCGIIDGFT